jgi:hypothetical protein
VSDGSRCRNRGVVAAGDVVLVVVERHPSSAVVREGVVAQKERTNVQVEVEAAIGRGHQAQQSSEREWLKGVVAAGDGRKSSSGQRNASGQGGAVRQTAVVETQMAIGQFDGWQKRS